MTSLADVRLPQHPAKFSDPILERLGQILKAEAVERGHALQVLDPMAGVGRIHELHGRYLKTTGVEIETEWAMAHERTKTGDARYLTKIFPRKRFDATVTSPCYGNRMADHHNAQDPSKRMTYRHTLGRELSPGSGAGLAWGLKYTSLHLQIFEQMVMVTKPGGLVVVNASNHMKLKEEILVSEWWLEMMLRHRLKLVSVTPVETRRMGFGSNREARVDNEWIFVGRKGA